MSNRKDALVPEAEKKLDKFKEEVAQELKIDIPHGNKDKLWGKIPAEKCGEVGGGMIKKMVENYEKSLVNKK
ncbi:alpha/beta-type small acid-soluble spore protein [Clostridium pasteurianum]|uniref:Small, acid-soluble spore protein, alpha/beta type n=1 Tax=Clostridium pasteurianum BC1 TaxID=86416 RepID=R4K8X1_CLOPA|nr:alpha/beta-type small acid-soluble spore protein [Clostridium pasteurianum]AGK96989.1 small, acid-soluble spore protein, alpha/beta type [Clostridium pasteurianum BC1]